MTERGEREIEITDVALPGGQGVGRAAGLVVFVPGAVPGDRVAVSIVGRKTNLAYGEICTILTPSPHRAEPVCPHFNECGGCALQHLSYAEQLRIKENHLLQTLKRLGGVEAGQSAFDPITPSPCSTGYRGKIELAFGHGGKGVVLGFRKQAEPLKPYSRPVTSIEECPVFGDMAKRALPFFVHFAERHHLEPCNPADGTGLLRHVILRESKTTGEMMVVLEVTRRNLPDMGPLWEELREALPGLSSFHVAVNRGKGDVIDYRHCEHLFGSPFIEERVRDFRFRLYPATFFQPSPGAAHLLHDRLLEWVTPWAVKRLLGLYCGGGAIEMALSSTVGHVTGIDSEVTNIRTAIENCSLNGITNCSFHRESVDNLTKSPGLRSFDLVTVDPPRTGLGVRALKFVASLGCKRVVYLSCNPATLARDLKLLAKAGYRAERVAPFDFLPHTSHLETLVLLEKDRPAPP